MQRKKGLQDIQPDGKRVLVRVDYNVPIENGEVGDDTRIVASMPTLRHLLQRGAKVVLMSHLGRPKGKPDSRYSLAPVAKRLERLLRAPVAFANDCVGAEAKTKADALENGQVLLLENLRFHAEEEKNDPAFAAELASLGEIYVDDAFGSAHRAHASTEGVARKLHPAVAGYLMQKELDYLGRALGDPERPFVAILGGAKISGKIDVLNAMLPKVDRMIVGGAMAFTFLRAQGLETGRSLVEEDRIEVARDLLKRARDDGKELLLPSDFKVSAATDGTAPWRIVAADAIQADDTGVDIGPASVRAFEAAVRDAALVVWNGPMGIFEVEAFAEGTLGVARALADRCRAGATVVVGGGDSVAAVHRTGLQDRFSHLSTGGGASLEFLAGKELPGVVALEDAGS